MSAAAIAGAAQTAIGIGQTIGGMIGAKKARNELEELERPFYKIQDELLQNRNLAASQAQMGVPQATMDYMTSENQRGLGSSLSAITQAGGSPNAIADLYAAYQRGNQQTAAMDAQQRVANLGQFLNQNAEVAGQKTMQWAINEFQPFQNKVQMLQQKIAQGNQMIGSGLSNALGGAASYGTATQNQDLIAQLKKLGEKDNTITPMTYQQVQRGIDQGGLALARQNLPQVANPTTMPNGQVQQTPYFASQRQGMQPDYSNRWSQYLPNQ